MKVSCGSPGVLLKKANPSFGPFMASVISLNVEFSCNGCFSEAWKDDSDFSGGDNDDSRLQQHSGKVKGKNK